MYYKHDIVLKVEKNYLLLRSLSRNLPKCIIHMMNVGVLRCRRQVYLRPQNISYCLFISVSGK